MEPPPRPGDALGEAGFETLCEHCGEDRHAQRGAAAPPLFQTSTFVFPDAEAYEKREQPGAPDYVYTRRANPTTAILETKLARLEQGTWCRMFASGMGAITAAINACLRAGDHVVAVNDCYGPTRKYLRDYLNRFNVSVTFVPGTRPDDFIAALRDETRLLYLESPTSGRFDVLEIPVLTAAARARGIRTIFDNSWATPYFQRPLDLGCDLVVHSATKFIGGHSDVLGGAVAGRDVELGRRVCDEAELLGASIDPFAAWLLLRGLRTLALRMEQHQRSGLAVARFLAEHPAVARVLHPGLPAHPNHAVAQRQLRGSSGLFSFMLRGQSRDATYRFLNRLRVFSIGCSWGGHESLALGGPVRELFNDTAGPEWIIRLHVGLESTADLVADVRQALED